MELFCFYWLNAAVGGWIAGWVLHVDRKKHKNCNIFKIFRDVITLSLPDCLHHVSLYMHS